MKKRVVLRGRLEGEHLRGLRRYELVLIVKIGVIDNI